MKSLFNNKVLNLIPLVFLIAIVVKIFHNYVDVKAEEQQFIIEEANVLKAYAMSHRNYYQKLFIDKTIPLNDETLSALPAYSSSHISKNFSENNLMNIVVRSVSDRARNPKNNADALELKAINFFKKNSTKDEYINDEDKEYYQYGYALRITKTCLTCHAKKEDAPLFIQQRYKYAYDYKLGEVRGILSIKIPKEKIDSYFMSNFMILTLYDLLILLTLFITILYLTRKIKKVNHYLEAEVSRKTSALQYSLNHDSLTGVPNRLKLIADLKQIKKTRELSLGLVNIDNFKDINDFYGHSIGDEVLVAVKDILKNLTKEKGYSLYKLPSDEFAILCTHKISKDKFTNSIKKILETIEYQKLRVDNEIYITFSAGVSFNADNLLLESDMALKISKTTKKNITVYDERYNIASKINKNMDGIKRIKYALENDLFTPFYQPIYDLHTKKIKKYESLIRIVENDGNVIAPYEFLDIAIKSKLYPQLTRTMISKAFDYFKDKEEYEFSINLSILDVLNKKTVDFIIKKLENFPNPERIIFEILESDQIEDFEILRVFIQKIKFYGVKFAIDDFGSGYSNFTNILQLHLDFLKIDASIVKNITKSETSRKTVLAIVNFASNVGLKTIAEYVEDKESLELLESLGVDYIQGYYIGKPEAQII